MKISLVHNPTAGDGQDVESVIRLLTEAGHDVCHRSSKDNWKKLLQDPGDLLVAAGGDGTVRKIAMAAAEKDLPFAVLPIGTANNFAKTFGLFGDARELVGTWGSDEELLIDVGEIRGGSEARRFVEAVGGGWIPDLIARGAEVEDEFRLLGRETDRATHLLTDILRDAKPMPWTISADGTDVSGEYLAVEILNIRFVGPNVPLAPAADPCDGLLDLVVVTESDRGAILEYLEQRLTLASGVMPALRSVRARQIRLGVPPGVRLHVDDAEWPADRDPYQPIDLEVQCLPAAVRMRAATPDFDQ